MMFNLLQLIPMDVLKHHVQPFIEKQTMILKEEFRAIPPNIHKTRLSKNPNAIGYLMDHPECIAWSWYSENPYSVFHLEQEPSSHLYWMFLYDNPNATYLIEQNPEKVDWEYFMSFAEFNPSCIHLIEQHIDKVDWHWLSGNPYAVDILEKNKNKIDWMALCTNPNNKVLEWIEKLDILSFERNEQCIKNLCSNTNPNALELLQRFVPDPERWDWNRLSSNPSAIHLLHQHPSKINGHCIVINPNIHLIDASIIDTHIEHMSDSLLSENPNAVSSVLKSHPEKIDWNFLLGNPSIFHPNHLYFPSMLLYSD